MNLISEIGPQTWIDLASPLVAPILTWIWLKFHDRLPIWLIPALCVSLGVAFNLIAKLAAHTDLNVWSSVALGLAGIGVRELQNQFRKAIPAIAPTFDSVAQEKAAKATAEQLAQGKPDSTAAPHTGGEDGPEKL